MEDYKELALEVIEGECLDMFDVFTADDIANAACKIIKYFKTFNRVVFDFRMGDYSVRVNNSKNNCFISFSNEESTGVSRSLYSIVNEEIDEYEMRDLITMLNEAWYTCEN